MKNLLLLLFMIANMASGAEITVKLLSNSDVHMVLLSGAIERSDARIFSEKISGISKAIVVLNSPGGSVVDGLSIGRSIRSKGFDTAVPDYTLCVSSCALIWLAGARRFAEDTSLVGFHAAYVFREGKPVEIGVGNALIGSYLNNLGLSDKAVIFVTSSPPEGIERLNRKIAQQIGIAYESINVPPLTNGNIRAAPSITPIDIEIRTNGYDPIAAVKRFYEAVSIADGNAAAALVIPAKRGIGPFNEKNIASFYFGMNERLAVQSIKQLDKNLIQVEYTYRVAKSQCIGVATVTTEYMMGNTFIKGIKANC